MKRKDILLKEYERNYYNKEKLEKFIKDNSDFRVPAYYDRVYKMLFNDINFVSAFLTHFVPLNKEEIKKTITYKTVEGEYINNVHKGSVADIIVELDNYIILFECNKDKRQAIIDKNMHTFRGMCYNAKEKGSRENKYKHCILISIDNYDHFKQNKIETKSKYMDIESKIEIIENETIYFINLESVRKKMYNTVDNTNLSTYDKMLMLMVVTSKSEARKLVEGDDLMKEVNEKIDNYTLGINNIMMSAQKVLENGYRHEFMAEGLKKGEKVGRKKGLLETAKELLKRNIDIKTIAECTKLDIKQIEKLQNKMKVNKI